MVEGHCVVSGEDDRLRWLGKWFLGVHIRGISLLSQQAVVFTGPNGQQHALVQAIFGGRRDTSPLLWRCISYGGQRSQVESRAQFPIRAEYARLADSGHCKRRRAGSFIIQSSFCFYTLPNSVCDVRRKRCSLVQSEGKCVLSPVKVRQKSVQGGCTSHLRGAERT